MILFSAMSVCVFVCLSVNTITPEPLEISSQHFEGIIPCFKGRTSSKIIVNFEENAEKLQYDTIRDLHITH